MPYAQACVKFYDGKIVLQSYATDVCVIENDYLETTGLYSMTTRKHISAFLKGYAPLISFQMAKACYLDDLKININTGEVVSLI